MNDNNLSIDFDFSHYFDADTFDINNKIVELTTDQVKCKRIIVSVIANGLELGRQYTVQYSLKNLDDNIFTPATETFFASKTTQKFSTVATINDSQVYIMNVLITRTGSPTSASDMVTVKCGSIINCPAVPVPIVLSEYVRFSNRPLLTVASPYRCDAQVNIEADINNATLGENYTYTFSSLETNPKTTISFEPATGVVCAGSEIQNINTVAKFIGQSNIYCIKLVVENENAEQFEDYLLVQCATCS
jgi:hypothetical protein